jgi:hypothetical protein
MAAVIFALPWLGSVLWLARDHRVTAERYGDDFIGPTNTHWVFGSLFRWPVFFPWYLVMRHRQRQSRPGRGNRVDEGSVGDRCRGVGLGSPLGAPDSAVCICL